MTIQRPEIFTGITRMAFEVPTPGSVNLRSRPSAGGDQAGTVSPSGRASKMISASKAGWPGISSGKPSSLMPLK
jgi:hypothetical protein